ncbi:LysR family transcriptional regulator [Kaistia dalseonensis]|uniref:DNA-binding transcriptional LysR family regulator n=1 Tax=Kaistia dalseonensis TaxID=410840 RepID=A0ABU0H0T4_9HYPH|nr:LysR family transcriptional regulator [Kaistia dalseonensis]MCX5493361.1 LysR family transcriptional regulator [Kaistia dalseonensis]MDQ0435919.1 DNA-binding transcriptional LysR family regulator [Kaistia dalseonensis]
MRDLDLRLLRYFIAIAEHASFSAAADALGVSQPALSQGLRRLEDVVGTPLIRRAPRGSPKALALTKVGEGLLEDSRSLLAHASRVLKRVADHADKTKIRIGFGTSTPQILTRDILRRAGELGNTEVSLEFVSWGDEVGSLERGDVDIIVLQARDRFLDPRLLVIPLMTVQRVAIFHVDHALAARSSVAMRDLDDVPIIDAASDRDYWIVNPRPTGRAPVTVGPAARTVDEMLTFVSAGRGMAITSATVAEKHNWPDLRFIPIADLEPATVFLAGLQSERRREIRTLIESFAKPKL